MRTTIARVLGTLRALVRRAFCRHDFKRYEVGGILTVNGPIRDEFEGVLCFKCGKVTCRRKPNAHAQPERGAR
jgi:hypothetical protein